MGVLSKLVLPVVLLSHSSVEALQKKKAPGSKYLTAFLGATTSGGAAGLAQEQQELQLKWQNNQDELTGLLGDQEMMEARFEDFMQEKYGDVCKDDGMGSKICNPYKLEDGKDGKYLAFQRNVELAKMRNDKQSQKDKTVVHGITSLSDLTRDEQWALLGYKAPPMEEMKQKKIESTITNSKFECDLASSSCIDNGAKDWRDDGFVTPVKDQGQCGSCWAFSTVQSMESAALAQGLYDTSSPYIGAPQELVSCDHGGDEGCQGGLPENAFKWLKSSSHALEEESKYPYTSGTTKKSMKCHMKAHGPGHLLVDSITTTGIMGIGETSDMTKYILNKGPMSVAVAANDNWFTYSGGVMDIDDCPEGQVDHAVQAVALDTDKKEWTIRNSWNANWGEEGFIRITYGKNTCNVAWDANAVKVKKADSSSSSQGMDVDMMQV